MSASVCTVTAADIEGGLAVTAVEYAERNLGPGMSFAVRARRSGVEGGFSSQELAAAVGSAVLDRIPEARVDLTAPDYEIFVEAGNTAALSTTRGSQGRAGFPTGRRAR